MTRSLSDTIDALRRVQTAPQVTASSATEPAEPSAALADIARDPDPFARLQRIDEQLVAAGFHPMSPWWSNDLERFYASGKTWGIYDVARGGGKSTTLGRVSVCETMTTPRVVPPGQRWPWLFVSVNQEDSGRRIREIAVMLATLGIETEPKMGNNPRIETLDAKGNPVAFQALAGTIAAVSGPTALGATFDEEQKIRDRNGNANPARELIASTVQTFRAKPGIRAIRCSSTFDEQTTHAASIREGDTDTNHIGRIGASFIDAARAGFLEVAAWEEQRGNRADAATIRRYVESLTVESPRIPVWLANPTIGAVASRVACNALPSTALGGLSRTAYWMRESGSVPVVGRGGGGKGARSSEDIAREMRMLAELNRRMSRPALHEWHDGPRWARFQPYRDPNRV